MLARRRAANGVESIRSLQCGLTAIIACVSVGSDQRTEDCDYRNCCCSAASPVAYGIHFILLLCVRINGQGARFEPTTSRLAATTDRNEKGRHFGSPLLRRAESTERWKPGAPAEHRLVPQM